MESPENFCFDCGFLRSELGPRVKRERRPCWAGRCVGFAMKASPGLWVLASWKFPERKIPPSSFTQYQASPWPWLYKIKMLETTHIQFIHPTSLTHPVSYIISSSYFSQKHLILPFAFQVERGGLPYEYHALVRRGSGEREVDTTQTGRWENTPGSSQSP